MKGRFCVSKIGAVRSSRGLAKARWALVCAAWCLSSAGIACSTEKMESEGAPGTADGCVATDPSSAPELRILYRGADGNVQEARAMDAVPLLAAPQGGRILLVGVRARNVQGCNVELSSALVDSPRNSVVSLEKRPIVLEMGADGWLSPKRPTASSNYSNLPGCPRSDLTRPVDGEVYQLRVSLVDSKGRTAVASLDVIPTCSGDVETCRCECSTDFNLGGGCSRDASVPAAEGRRLPDGAPPADGHPP
jgi:hypothetical protein